MSYQYEDTISKQYMIVLDELEDVLASLMQLDPNNATDKVTFSLLEPKKQELESRIKILEDVMWDDQLGSEPKEVECPECASADIENHDYWSVCGNCNHVFQVDVEKIFDIDDVLDKFKLHTPKMDLKLTQVTHKTCKSKHLHQPVELPDGTVVHCTAHYNAASITHHPTFGLYADAMWARTAEWRNEIINWPDFGLPTNKDIALDQIEDAFNRARDGVDVDLGCIGAHGRTGTILACMVLLADPEIEPAKACAWVWENYCKEAIENKSQEWFVAYAAGYYYGVEVPDPPAKPVYSAPVGAGHPVCLPIHHYAMYKAGLKDCKHKNDCSWWDRDMEELQSKGTIGQSSVAHLSNDVRFETLLKEYSEDNDGKSFS